MTSSWGMIKVSCYLLLCSAIATVTTDPSDSDFNVETLTASPSGKLCAVSVTIMIIANRKCLYCAQGHENTTISPYPYASEASLFAISYRDLFPLWSFASLYCKGRNASSWLGSRYDIPWNNNAPRPAAADGHRNPVASISFY